MWVGILKTNPRDSTKLNFHFLLENIRQHWSHIPTKPNHPTAESQLPFWISHALSRRPLPITFQSKTLRSATTSPPHSFSAITHTSRVKNTGQTKKAAQHTLLGSIKLQAAESIYVHPLPKCSQWVHLAIPFPSHTEQHRVPQFQSLPKIKVLSIRYQK